MRGLPGFELGLKRDLSISANTTSCLGSCLLTPQTIPCEAFAFAFLLTLPTLPLVGSRIQEFSPRSREGYSYSCSLLA
jgi:hypothetical protein